MTIKDRAIKAIRKLPDSATWEDIGEVTVGDATAIGGARTSLSSAVIPVLNMADYQIRLYSYTQGSAVSATVTADVYPLEGARA